MNDFESLHKPLDIGDTFKGGLGTTTLRRPDVEASQLVQRCRCGAVATKPGSLCQPCKESA